MCPHAQHPEGSGRGLGTGWLQPHGTASLLTGVPGGCGVWCCHLSPRLSLPRDHCSLHSRLTRGFLHTRHCAPGPSPRARWGTGVSPPGGQATALSWGDLSLSHYCSALCLTHEELTAFERQDHLSGLPWSPPVAQSLGGVGVRGQLRWAGGASWPHGPC